MERKYPPSKLYTASAPLNQMRPILSLAMLWMPP